MTTALPKLLISGLCFIFIFVFGIWLSKKGKPYNSLLVTVHKLIGLGLGIYLGLNIYGRHQITPLTPIEIAATTATILLFALNTATGSLLSTEKNMPSAVSMVNKIIPYFTVVSSGITIALIF